MSKEDHRKLDHLEEEIERVEKKRAAEKRKKGFLGNRKNQQIGWAWRVGIDLVSAVIVGFGIGYLLDYILGTKPWLMIVFFMLGSAAGIRNIYRMIQTKDKGLDK